MKGIDVSVYQGNINWELVKKENVEFAILKVVNKNLTTDRTFEYNYVKCQEIGIPVGVYNYSYATTVDKAVLDAKSVISVLNKRKLQHKIWLDVEDNVQKNIGMRLIDIIIAYKNVIEQNGYAFGVYTGLSFYNSYIKSYAKYINCPFWIARYPSNQELNLQVVPPVNKKPEIKHELWGWQYTSKGKIKGISGYVDLNIIYGKTAGEEEGEGGGIITQGVKQFKLPQDSKSMISTNFAVEEFKCKDGNANLLVDVTFVADKLQTIRKHFNVPLTIISGYRTREYNKLVGGAVNSFHLQGRAFDISVQNRKPEEVARFAQTIGIKGIIQYDNFVHLDSRDKKYWAKNMKGKIEIVDHF